MGTAESRRISEDLRYELADAARIAEVANKPRSLLALATVLFLIAGVALIWTLRSHEAAAGRLESQSGYLRTVENLQTQYAVLADIESKGPVNQHGPLPDLYSRIEAAARAAGLVNDPPIPQDRSQSMGGLRKNTYIYKMQDPSLQNLLTWVEQARRRVPGLEVSSLEILPAAKHWNFNVTFVRWERPS